jgi:hypothetical protein
MAFGNAKRAAARQAKEQARESEARSRQHAAEAEATRLRRIAQNHELVSAARQAVAGWFRSVGERQPPITITGVTEAGWANDLHNYSSFPRLAHHEASVSMTWRLHRYEFRATHGGKPATLNVEMEVDRNGRPLWLDIESAADLGRKVKQNKRFKR